MSDGLALYCTAPDPIGPEIVRPLAPDAEIAVEHVGHEARPATVVRWPGLTVRLTAMPADRIAGHLEGLRGWLREICGIVDDGDGIFERFGRTQQVVGCVAEPAPDARCEELLIAVARRLDGLLFRADGVFDPDGRCLAAPDPGNGEPPEPEPPVPLRVARRALALAAVVYRAFIETADVPEPPEVAQRRLQEWLERHELERELERSERRLIESPVGELDEQEVIDASWRSEGLAVLAWALEAADLPPHDVQSEPAEVSGALGLLSDELPRVLVRPRLRDADELQWQWRRLLALHWRLRDHGLAPRHLDFTELADKSWFGGFDIEGIPLAEGDLAIDGDPIDRADPQAVQLARSIALERHQAINWLRGDHPTYSEVDTST